MLLRGLSCRITVTRLRRLIAVVIGVPKKKPVSGEKKKKKKMGAKARGRKHSVSEI